MHPDGGGPVDERRLLRSLKRLCRRCKFTKPDQYKLHTFRHAFASMCDGYQEGEEIECPLHEGRFNIKTGEALCPPVSEALRVFEVKLESDKVLVKI